MTWIACAMVFSGRPDPTWTLPPERADELLALWRTLPPSSTVAAPRAVLGYRGCWVRGPDGARFVAFDGTVVRQAPGTNVPETRADTGRRFERTVLVTAPADTLPPGVGPPGVGP